MIGERGNGQASARRHDDSERMIDRVELEDALSGAIPGQAILAADSGKDHFSQRGFG